MKRIINEDEVRAAAKSTKIIFLDDQSIVTPAAADLAKEKGVIFEPMAGTPEQQSSPGHVQDHFPVRKVAIASDHGGFTMKEELKPFIEQLGLTVLDLGTNTPNPCDYPDFAFPVAELVAQNKVQRGIIIDSVGIGSAMASNRVKGVLAAKCNNAYEARSSREHNYANVLTMGAKMIGIEIAKDIVKVFLQTPGGAERHQKRVEKILSYKPK